MEMPATWPDDARTGGKGIIDANYDSDAEAFELATQQYSPWELGPRTESTFAYETGRRGGMRPGTMEMTPARAPMRTPVRGDSDLLTQAMWEGTVSDGARGGTRRSGAR